MIICDGCGDRTLVPFVKFGKEHYCWNCTKAGCSMVRTARINREAADRAAKLAIKRKRRGDGCKVHGFEKWANGRCTSCDGDRQTGDLYM